ncbi:MAG: BMP family ABC transporter substrate-binding protein [Bdellovibrionales bacterium]|nr:BMP family ABC transporter substrate-binding protein [Bdellovibrionales bacterium]
MGFVARLLRFSSLVSVFGSQLVLAAPVNIALVLDKGGKDDKSFNGSAYIGMQRAEKELKVKLKVVEASDDNSFEPVLRAFAQRKYDLIVSIGFSQAEAVRKVAAQFPQVHFAIVDAEVTAPNVQAIMFEEQEGSYIIGAIAALESKKGVVGFVGGMDTPLIRRFQMGYDAGAKKVQPKIKVLTGYVGITSEAWNNPPKAKELALSQYKQNADVIFTASGASNAGVFDAAEESGHYAIGVDSNQNWMKPGRIMTSMLKRVDLAVFEAAKAASEGKFTSGVDRHGLRDGLVDFAMDEYNAKLVSPATLAKVKSLRADIVSGKISVPDYYKIGGKK